MELFHFTDTSRLPWILSSGELRPGGNKAGGFPSPEFVWATTNPLGDASASVAGGAPYQSGKVRHIRITLGAEHFIPWSDVPRTFPAWTGDHVKRLESYAKDGVVPHRISPGFCGRGWQEAGLWGCRETDTTLPYFA